MFSRVTVFFLTVVQQNILNIQTFLLGGPKWEGEREKERKNLRRKKSNTFTDVLNKEKLTQFCNGVLAHKEMRLTKIAYPVMLGWLD